jgi:hypothetical protein
LPAAALAREHYAVRLEGLVDAPFTETFTFFLIAEGQATFTIAGKQARTTNGTGPMFETTVDVPLTSGKRTPFIVEYIPNGPAATAALQLRWKSKSTPKSNIPMCRLYPVP